MQVGNPDEGEKIEPDALDETQAIIKHAFTDLSLEKTERILK